MAITIHQEPTSPNIVNNDLLYVCTSTKTSEAQMQFVCDIKDDNNVLIQRIKQQPNPSNKAVFNVGQIMTGYFDNADRIWDIGASARLCAVNTGSALQFKVYFGEEYADSVSSSVELYDGIQNATTGSPELSGSSYYLNLYGSINELALTDWNWSSGSKLDYEVPSSASTYSHQNGLTNSNTASVAFGDYHTISYLNGNVVGDAPQADQAQDVYAFVVYEYDTTGSLIRQRDFYNSAFEGGGPRSTSVRTWTSFDTYLDQNESTKLIHFGVGPQNFEDATYAISESTAYYDVEFYGQLDTNAINYSGSWGRYRFNIQDCSGFTPQRFAWKNQYGVWDYFNFTKANNRQSTINRKEYTQTFVDYSTTGDIVRYDKERRGRVNHYNEITKQRVANTDWLTQTEADDLRELFYSTDVYYYNGNLGWVPVVITTANITERTNDLSQKVFQYEMAYELAIGQRPRQ